MFCSSLFLLIQTKKKTAAHLTQIICVVFDELKKKLNTPLKSKYSFGSPRGKKKYSLGWNFRVQHIEIQSRVIFRVTQDIFSGLFRVFFGSFSGT